MIGGSMWARSEYHNLHFDNKYDMGSRNYEAKGYWHDLDWLVILY